MYDNDFFMVFTKIIGKCCIRLQYEDGYTYVILNDQYFNGQDDPLISQRVPMDFEKLKNSIALAKFTSEIRYHVFLGPFNSIITESRFFQYLDNIEKYGTLYSPENST